MEYKFDIGDFYKNWDEVHYKTVAIIITDEDIDMEEVVIVMMTALCKLELFKAGDQYKAAKAGNTIVIGKAHLYIDMDGCDSVN